MEILPHSLSARRVPLRRKLGRIIRVYCRPGAARVALPSRMISGRFRDACRSAGVTHAAAATQFLEEPALPARGSAGSRLALFPPTGPFLQTRCIASSNASSQREAKSEIDTSLGSLEPVKLSDVSAGRPSEVAGILGVINANSEWRFHSRSTAGRFAMDLFRAA